MRSFWLFDDIDECALYRISSFLEGVDDGSECTIEITSHGGLVFYGNAIFQKIQEAQKRGVKFTAKVYGVAASSAADIVLVCDRIEMSSTSSIMIHSARNGNKAAGKDDDGIRIANAAQLSVIKKRLPEYTEEDLKTDRWFTAKEALKIGLIDCIFDTQKDSIQAKLCAKYLAIHANTGGVAMEEEVKREETTEEVEKKEENKEPSIEEVLERISERFDAIEERLRKIEEASAECGERRDNARMRAIYNKISAISKPAVSHDSLMKTEKQEDPKAELKRCKEKFSELDRLSEVDF